MKDTAHIIVFGNEKGGSGKSTTAMHTAIALLRMGYKVGTLDLDARQGTFTRYLKNRFQYILQRRENIPSPEHMAIERSKATTVAEQQIEEAAFMTMALDELSETNDFVIIDTPGTDCFLSRLAHSHADTLITPMNDSFIDLDLLANIDMNNFEIKGPSVYSAMVEEQRRKKMIYSRKTIDWIVMRNRIPHLSTNNNKIIADLLEKISKLANFRLTPGFGERVVFKELFLKGLTLMDLKEYQNNELTMSQISARQEIRTLIKAIGPERFKGHRKPLSPDEIKNKKISAKNDNIVNTNDLMDETAEQKKVKSA
ncbi:MAG: division plane positioning ATPase MipZ [Alphaproteobacteria bacterium]|nr:division plane positioning ATPase MipZ [Alphaproteobacteria bacterium]